MIARLVIFVACFVRGCQVYSLSTDRFVVRFIVDATPVLFPPARISLRVCSEKDEVINLSKELSRNHLMHDIRNIDDALDQRIYDNLEHQNLYVLDADCDNASGILNKASSDRMFIAPTKWLILRDCRGSMANDSKVSDTDDYIFETFGDLALYPDSDVIVARRVADDFVEILSPYRPSPYRELIIEDRGNWTSSRGLTMKNRDVASRRRRNLQMTPLKSCLVMTEPSTINHLTDYHDKHIDPITKANYPWILQIVDRMNATISFNVTNTWGYRSENGSWSGMIGMLDRREIDIGGTGTFFISQRIGVVKYIQLYTRTGSRFVFRKPLVSSVSNIFTLPFHRSVWIAVGTLLALVFVLLYVTTRWEFYRGASVKSAKYWSQMNPAEPTASENMLVLLGAIAQQGYSYEPYRVPSRIVTLMLLLAALSLYASYTANIVALLQSTTDSIKTLADLLDSPLRLGVQDVVYNRYYFKTFQDPVRKGIVEKIEGKGKKSAWMTVEEGAQQIKDGLFAFHVEKGTLYKIMQDTYQEDEKCGLHEIDCLKVLYPLMVIPVQSPYLEIVKNSALLLTESGLKFREEYRLYTKMPICHGHTSFISIGITECYFALLTMAYGALITIGVFVVELLWYKRRMSKMKDFIEDGPFEIDDEIPTSA